MTNIQFNIQDVHNWILDKFENTNCSFCGKNAWEFSDKLWHITEYAPQSAIVRIGGIPMGGQSLVMVFLICLNCKQVHLFNAIAVAMTQMQESKIAKSPPVEGLKDIH